MSELSPLIYDRFQFPEISRFLDLLTTRKCRYYASDFLNQKEREITEIEHSVQRTLEIFKTLDVPTDEHFYVVYRYDGDTVLKDWRISELACVYMLVTGDPTDLKALAHQQTELIDQMLQHIHPQQVQQPAQYGPTTVRSQGQY